MTVAFFQNVDAATWIVVFASLRYCSVFAGYFDGALELNVETFSMWGHDIMMMNAKLDTHGSSRTGKTCK